MALANVAQERRLKSIEHQVEQVSEEIEHVKEGVHNSVSGDFIF